MGDGSALAYQHCRLLSNNCTVPSLGISDPSVEVTSGARRRRRPWSLLRDV